MCVGASALSRALRIRLNRAVLGTLNLFTSPVSKKCCKALLRNELIIRSSYPTNGECPLMPYTSRGAAERAEVRFSRDKSFTGRSERDQNRVRSAPLPSARSRCVADRYCRLLSSEDD